MTNILILVLTLLALMALFIGLGIYFHRHPGQEENNDRVYLNSDGNHEYYDRSLIEKNRFLRKHPEAKGKLRTLSRLFKGNK